MNGVVNGGSAVLTDSLDSLSSSRLVGSGHASDASAKRAASQISRAYKQGSQFFLQRRFPESLFTIQPLITRKADGARSAASDDGTAAEQAGSPAPIASASRAARVKVWSLYITLLNSIVELGPEDGKNQFGNAQWRVMERKVRDGSVWEDVVQNGYNGAEGSVDPDVVSNLATLLLSQSPTQAVNQRRLEAYLAASSQPDLDVSGHFDANGEATHAKGRPAPYSRSGTDTPRDLNSRIKILELYALHVLPRNNEWQYAKDFVGLSDILDDDTREEFLQTLSVLEDEQRIEVVRERELKDRADAEDTRRRDADRKLMEDAQLERSSSQASSSRRPASGSHRNARSPSEMDYGIEDSGPPPCPAESPPGPPYRPTRKTPSKSSLKDPRASQQQNGSTTRLSAAAAAARRPPKKHPPPRTLLERSALLMANLQQTVLRMARNLSASPLPLLRLLLFVAALLLALARNDVRQRLSRVLGLAWDRLRKTVGMGVKVSYI